MPKLKTKSSAKKRFRFTSSGKVKKTSGWKKARYDQKNKFTNKKIERLNDNDKAGHKNSKIVYALQQIGL